MSLSLKNRADQKVVGYLTAELHNAAIDAGLTDVVAIEEGVIRALTTNPQAREAFHNLIATVIEWQITPVDSSREFKRTRNVWERIVQEAAPLGELAIADRLNEFGSKISDLVIRDFDVSVLEESDEYHVRINYSKEDHTTKDSPVKSVVIRCGRSHYEELPWDKWLSLINANQQHHSKPHNADYENTKAGYEKVRKATGYTVACGDLSVRTTDDKTQLSVQGITQQGVIATRRLQVIFAAQKLSEYVKGQKEKDATSGLQSEDHQGSDSPG